MSNKKFIVDSNQAPRAIGPYSQAVGYNGLLYVTQQLPVDSRTGDMSSGGVEQQTRMVMDHLQAILMAAGLDFSHVLKTTIYLRNINDFDIMSDIYALYFDHSPPARAVVEVSRLSKDALVAIDLIAAVPADYTEGREDANYDDVQEDDEDVTDGDDATPLDHPGPPDDLEADAEDAEAEADAAEAKAEEVEQGSEDAEPEAAADETSGLEETSSVASIKKTIPFGTVPPPKKLETPDE